MKSEAFSNVSSEILENSLYDCITFDGKHPRRTSDETKPLLVGAGIICLCLQGRGTFVINETSYEVQRGSLITILPNTVVGATTSTEDFLGYAIVADIKFMTTLRMPDAIKSYIHIATNPVLSLADEQMNNLIALGEMLKRKSEFLDEGQKFFNKEISRHLLAALCYEIYSLYHNGLPEGGGNIAVRTRQGQICQEFMLLVEKHAGESRDMGFYADKLCITPKYLSVVVKKASGHSPVEWIDRTVMCYARTLLTSSDMTVQQIAAELNFPNPSFFGQYFKRHEGVTPKQFRLKNRI